MCWFHEIYHQVLAYEALVARLQSELRWEKERRQSCDQDRISSKLEV